MCLLLPSWAHFKMIWHAGTAIDGIDNKNFIIMKSTLLLLIISVVLAFDVSAQKKLTGSIGGQINDKEGNPVGYATLMLLNKDSVLVKADFSRENGSFVFDNLSEGNYQIKLRSIQFEPYVSQMISLQEGQNIRMEPIVAVEIVKELAEVQVTASKPLIEVHPDKTVFNVSASPNTAGTDGLEMLRKAPGIVIDNNDNIILQGKSGVKVYVDGKPTRLSGSDLVNMLRNMQSDGVESVDIITNPSAKYDAEGNAGIIDIKLKRDKNLGLKSTINGSYGMGMYSRYHSGIDFNYRDRKLNIFGNYNFRDNTGYSSEHITKTIGNNFLDQQSEFIWKWKGHGYRIGADYLISKQHLVGIVVNGSINRNNVDISSSTPFGNLQNNVIERRLDASSDRIMNFQNVNTNINYVYTGSDGARINIDADYGYHYRDGGSNQSNIYVDNESGAVIDERNSGDVQVTKIDIRAIKSDYEKAFGSGKVAFGAKFSDIKTDNCFDYFNIIDEGRVPDMNRSNDFMYTERIGAAYLSYNGKVNSKLTYVAGLRTEITNSLGLLENSHNSDESRVSRSYADIFPSGGFAYQFNKKNKLALNYSRRIDRPRYESLNPFEFQLDELTFRKGNPFLNPQYTNSYKLTHSFNHKLNTQISYSKTNDYFAQLLDTLGGKVTMISVQNMSSFQNIGLNVNYSLDITKKWGFYANTTLYKSFYRSDIPGKNINLNASSLNIYAKSNYQLPSDINLEISGWYNSPSIWGGTFQMDRLLGIDMGIRKPLWDKKASLKVSMSDVFKTNGFHGTSEYGGLKTSIRGEHDSRRMTFSFTYNLGNQHVKGSRSRTTGLDEEKNRLGGDGQ
jgi:iron complex outermembrane recepter protein